VVGAQGSPYLEEGHWQISLGYRWQRSDRHFSGIEEQKIREVTHTESINEIHLFDLGATYQITERLSLSGSLPYLIAERSEPISGIHGERNHTEARGFGDFSLVPRFWVLQPSEHPTGNLSLGIGGKAPTGEDAAKDNFVVRNRETGQREVVVQAVDQSIQPGDGGWGIVLDVQAFKSLGYFTPYATGTYLINPQDTNHVRTGRSARGEEVMSVPDQYLGRIGISMGNPWIEGLAVSVGGRVEGVPPKDLWGDSNGFRRPGYAFSIEPGIAFSIKGHTFGLSAPIAVWRERQRSVPEAANHTHGDAAFADYVILFGYSYRF